MIPALVEFRRFMQRRQERQAEALRGAFRSDLVSYYRDCNLKNIAEYDKARQERDDALHSLRVRTQERDKARAELRRLIAPTCENHPDRFAVVTTDEGIGWCQECQFIPGPRY